MLLAPRHPEQWGYVYDIGGPTEITAWALRQRGAGEVENGLNTLAAIYIANRLDGHQQAAAGVRGDILKIFSKLLTGWPKYPDDGRDHLDSAGSTADDDRSREIYGNIRGGYLALAGIAPPLFFEQEPDAVKFPRRHAAWSEAAQMTNVFRLGSMIPAGSAAKQRQPRVFHREDPNVYNPAIDILKRSNGTGPILLENPKRENPKRDTRTLDLSGGGLQAGKEKASYGREPLSRRRKHVIDNLCGRSRGN